MRELTRRELQAETEDDIMVMVADTRATILAGFVAGTAVTAGFIAAVVLVTGLWGVLQAFRFGMLVGLTGFVVLAAIVGLLSFFIPRFPTTRAVAGILVLTVAVIISSPYSYQMWRFCQWQDASCLKQWAAPYCWSLVFGTWCC